MKRIACLLSVFVLGHWQYCAVPLATIVPGCTTSQTFNLTDLVTALGVGLDLASKWGLLASLGVTQ